MAWLWLLGSAVLEAVWANALHASEGFTRPLWIAVFLAAAIASFFGLAHALKSIPLGTAYAIWTGLGAALTVAWALLTGAETVSVWKLVFLIGIVGAVIGLKLVPAPAGAAARSVAGAEDQPPVGRGA